MPEAATLPKAPVRRDPLPMKMPTVTGIIKRRFLINFRIDPEVLARYLPPPFEPKIHNGYGIGGICLIRLERIRPKSLPIPFGLSSENAAHRFAVTWGDNEGVFIPRRDTNSLINLQLGGRIFPGIHHLARFDIAQSSNEYRFAMESRDRTTQISFHGSGAAAFPKSSCFASVGEASTFFEEGSIGYSVSRDVGVFDGLELQTDSWQVRAFNARDVYSSFFSDRSVFPSESIAFDHALIMEDVAHVWRPLEQLDYADLESGDLGTNPAQC